MTFIMETATVAAIITAASSMFATIVTTIINNRRLKEIEKERWINEFETYRYTKLYSLLEDIEAERNFIYYENDDTRTFKEAFNMRPKLISYYKLTRTLLDAKYRTNLNSDASFENEQYEKVLKIAYNKNSCVKFNRLK